MAKPRRRRFGGANIEEHPAGSGLYRVRAKIGGDLVMIASKLRREQAEAAADEYAERRDAGGLREGLTLAGFGPTFLDLRKRRGVRAVDKDRQRWASYVDRDELGAIAIASLRRSDIVKWRDRLLGSLRPQTVRNALNLLRVALNDALDRELVQANVARDVRVPRGLSAKADEDLSGVLLPAEQGALLEAVPAQWKMLVAAALFTGLRWSELAYLRRDDIQGDVLVVRRSVKGGPTKSGKARRVPLLAPARAALDVQLAGVPKSCPWVFPTVDGKPRRFRPAAWHRWVSDAGIERRVRWHDLRHTCATSLLAGWWSEDGHRWALDEVCAMLGHASQSTTEIYARKVDETLSRAAKRTTIKEFPGGSEIGPKSLKSPAQRRFPKPWVSRSSRLGGASEIIEDFGAEEIPAGNFLGTAKRAPRRPDFPTYGTGEEATEAGAFAAGSVSIAPRLSVSRMALAEAAAAIGGGHG